MSLVKYTVGLLIAMVLSACGGGGGSAGSVSGGTTSGSTGGTAVATAVPTLTLSIVDATDTPAASNSIGSGASFYVKAVVKDAAALAVANKLVTFSVNTTVASLSQSAALTDSNGIAKVQISPVSLTANNAGNLVASVSVNQAAVSADLDFQTAPANVSLTGLTVGTSTISALQSTAVSVTGLINGTLAGNSALVVNFSAVCGSFSPASASTNSSGVAITTYQSAVNCSGSIPLTAQPAGVPGSTVSATVSVTAAQATNVVFSSASEPLMVTSAATGGIKQSTLTFQVLNASGTGMAGQSVVMSLGSAALDAGVSFSIGGNSVVSSQAVVTNNEGYASVIVSSGGLPTPVIVTAALFGSPGISASSSGVSVTSGRPTQNAASLSATKLSIEGFSVDGVQSQVTMRVADRQGNPVPAGTAVNFVASHGLIQGACNLDSLSSCSVSYTSQGTRPSGGRAVILAYLDGEESFADLNGDNIWQSGESFYDVGTLYRDENEDGIYNSGEQTYPGGALGNVVCLGAESYAYPSIAGTCDGTWSSSIRVRKQLVLALSTTQAVVSLVGSRAASGFVVNVTDTNANSMATGTIVEAAVVTSQAVCKVTSVSPGLVRNSPNGGTHAISLDGAPDCATVRIEVTVTPPSGVKTVVGF